MEIFYYANGIVFLLGVIVGMLASWAAYCLMSIIADKILEAGDTTHVNELVKVESRILREEYER